MLTVRDSALDDFQFVARRLRRADRLELRYASGGREPTEVLESYFKVARLSQAAPDSVFLKTAFAGDEPVALFGANPALSLGVAYCWMVGTGSLRSFPLDIARGAKGHIDAMLSVHPILTNIVWDKNTLHVNWLHRTGFVFLRPLYNYNGSGQTFLQFMKHGVPMDMARILDKRWQLQGQEDAANV